jgi:hypothetical protein
MESPEVVEIVGVHGSSLGRCCERHEECGRSLQLNDLVLFRQAFLLTRKGIVNDISHCHLASDQTVLGVEAVRLEDGYPSCTVGFLSRRNLPHREKYLGKLGQVVGNPHASLEAPERNRSDKHYGIRQVALLGAYLVNH